MAYWRETVLWIVVLAVGGWLVGLIRQAIGAARRSKHD